MGSLVAWFQETLLPYGGPGLLVLAALDSSIVPMPQVFDVVVLLSCSLEPQQAWVYAAWVTFGSTLGTLVVFGVARAGRAHFGQESPRLHWAEAALRTYGILPVSVAAMLPAPFPFKYVVLAAGYLRQPVAAFTVAVVVGRGVRFALTAIIALRYGNAIVGVVDRYAWAAGLAMVLVLLLTAFGYRLLRRRMTRTPA